MTETEFVIYSLIGYGNGRVRPLACAVDQTAKLLFEQQRDMEELRLFRDVYAAAAEQLHMSLSAASSSIERCARRIWDEAEPSRLREVIGRQLPTAGTAKELLVYLAFYVHTGAPFYRAAALPGKTK